MKIHKLENSEPIEYMGKSFVIRVTQGSRFPFYYFLDGEVSNRNYQKENQAIAAAKSKIEVDRHHGVKI